MMTRRWWGWGCTVSESAGGTFATPITTSTTINNHNHTLFKRLCVRLTGGLERVVLSFDWMIIRKMLMWLIIIMIRTSNNKATKQPPNNNNDANTRRPNHTTNQSPERECAIMRETGRAGVGPVSPFPRRCLDHTHSLSLCEKRHRGGLWLVLP